MLHDYTMQSTCLVINSQAYLEYYSIGKVYEYVFWPTWKITE